MIAYRICHQREVNRKYGLQDIIPEGRWHYPGVRLWYAASSKSLCMLDLSAVIPLSLLKKEQYRIVHLYIPDDIMMQIPAGRLESHELRYPLSVSTMKRGSEIAKEGFMPFLKVPSALVPEEFYYLIFFSEIHSAMVNVLEVHPI
jgi:RES domain-containing protein